MHSVTNDSFRGHLFYRYYVVVVCCILSATSTPANNWSLVTEQQQVLSEGLARTVWHVLHELNCSAALVKHPTPSDDIFRLHVLGAEASPEGGSSFSILLRFLRSIGWQTLSVHLIGYEWGGECPHSNPGEGLNIECDRGAYEDVYSKLAHPPTLAVLLEPGVFDEPGLWYDSLALLLDLKVPLLLTVAGHAEMAHGPWFVEAARAWTEPPMQRCTMPARSQMMLNADLPKFYERVQSLCRISRAWDDHVCFSDFSTFLTLDAMDILGASLLAGPTWNPYGFLAQARGMDDVDPGTYFSGILFVMQGQRTPRFTRGRFHLHMMFRAAIIGAVQADDVDRTAFAWLMQLFEETTLFESLPTISQNVLTIFDEHHQDDAGLYQFLVDSAKQRRDVGVVFTRLKSLLQRYGPDRSHLADHEL